MRHHYFFFLFFALTLEVFSTKSTIGDTIYFFDETNDITYKINTSDYYTAVKAVLPDSIGEKVIHYITNTQDSISNGTRKNNSIEVIYYLSMDFYDRQLHGLAFDRILYNLFFIEKLYLLKNDKCYSVKNTRTKVKRAYCCHNPFLYCGKDWIIFDKKKELTRFSKSVTTKTYVIRSCF